MSARDEPRLGMLETEFERVIAQSASVRNLSGNRLRLVRDDPAPTWPDETLRERERRFRTLLEALPAAVYTTDTAGRITFYNQAAVDLWGHRPELGASEWCGSWKLYWPDGSRWATMNGRWW